MRRREFISSTTGMLATPLLSSGYDSCDGDSIIDAVNQSGIDELYEPWRGDCWHIGVALKDAYNADLRCLYHSNDIKYPVHVFVEYDDVYYDGYGRLSVSSFLDEWPNTIPDVVDITREDVTDVPYYSDSKRVNIYGSIVQTEAYSSWGDC